MPFAVDSFARNDNVLTPYIIVDVCANIYKLLVTCILDLMTVLNKTGQMV